MLNQFIWWNSHICVNDAPFFNSTAYNRGLKYIHQLVNDSGTLLTAQEIATLYEIPIMVANSLLLAIPKTWKNILSEFTETDWSSDSSISNYEQIRNQKHPAAFYYKSITLKYSVISQVYNKWSNIIDVDIVEIERAFKNIYRATNYTKLRSFQYRLLHKAIILNDRLIHWGLAKSNLCNNCQCAKESTYHFFVECSIIQKIWVDAQRWLKTEYNIDTSLKPKDIILNSIHPKAENVANLLCLVVKQKVYSAKCLQKKPDFKNIKEEFLRTRTYEEFNAKKKGKLNLHYKKWGKIEKTKEFDYVHAYLEQM